MSYQVLARKYRPLRFSDVIGQSHIVTTLQNALTQDRIHHAYLFTGARGIGKTTIARILAKSLNCEKRDGVEPCGSCQTCMDITSGASMDVQEIDGASNTSVDDVREIRERIKYLPSSGKYKIYIIDEVHMLSNSAFNALLKTLEEPPSHVIFIFATTEVHKIPATILSRCQRYDFRRIPKQEIIDALMGIAAKEHIAVEESVLRFLAHESTGSMRDAQSLFDQAIAFGGDNVSLEQVGDMLGTWDRVRLFELVSAIIQQNPMAAILHLGQAYDCGADLNRLASAILELLHHLIMLKEDEQAGTHLDIVDDECTELMALSQLVTPEQLQRMFHSWYQVVESVSRSGLPKMLLEVGLIRLCHIGPIESIESLIDEVRQLGVSLKVAAVPDISVSTQNISQEKQPAQFEAVEQNTVIPDNANDRWDEFVAWVSAKKPQVASLLQNGIFMGIEGTQVRLTYSNPLYADMMQETDRQDVLNQLLSEFFKKNICITIGRIAEKNTSKAKQGKKKEIVKQALSDDIVKQAATILDARIHDIRVETEDA